MHWARDGLCQSGSRSPAEEPWLVELVILKVDIAVDGRYALIVTVGVRQVPGRRGSAPPGVTVYVPSGEVKTVDQSSRMLTTVQPAMTACPSAFSAPAS